MRFGRSGQARCSDEDEREREEQQRDQEGPTEHTLGALRHEGLLRLRHRVILPDQLSGRGRQQPWDSVGMS